jgi:hypothetical protein
MKRFVVFVSSLVLAMAYMVAPAFAAGLPAAHGVSGRVFGGLVSQLAQANPAALVEHIRMCAGM